MLFLRIIKLIKWLCLLFYIQCRDAIVDRLLLHTISYQLLAIAAAMFISRLYLLA